MRSSLLFVGVFLAVVAIRPPARAGEAPETNREILSDRPSKERMRDQRLFARGGPRIYRDEYLTGISLPVGGIGTGNIQINGNAERHEWLIFNNFTPALVPHSFFAVRTKTEGAQAIVRALQTSAVGPFRAMEKLRFRGEYPFGWYDFEDPALPVAVRMETFNPLIPMDPKNSGIPCAVYSLAATNQSDKPAEVAFLATQQNAVGYTAKPDPRKPPRWGPSKADPINGRRHAEYGANRNRIIRQRGATVLHMTSDKGANTGDMALAVFEREAAISTTASWNNLQTLHTDFSDGGRLNGDAAAGPSPAGQTLDGALAASFTLEPGQTRTITFVLTWYFPDARHGTPTWGGAGNMYTNWWSDALDVSLYLNEHLNDLNDLTRRYHDTLYETNLPYWLLDRISSQVDVIRSQTCFWTKAGFFGGWEGACRPFGCCPGNCAHVWHYAQSHARLFPSIARRMREQALAHQGDNGGIPFRLSAAGRFALDGQCGEILEAYREHLTSPDGAWLAAHWPRIRKAMEFVIATWDPDGDGVLSGQQHNTLDAEMSGSSSWLGTLYLAALAASEKMAILEDQAEVAQRFRRIRHAGAKAQNSTLFNGEYYIQIPDQPPDRLKGENYLTGCHIDQLLGQWWAHQLELGWLYPPDRVRTALESLFRYNFRTNFRDVKTYARGFPARGQPRKFVLDRDHGTLMTTWPKGGRPPKGKHLRFADEVWTGTEYSAAATMIGSGLLEEAFTVVRAASDRHDGRKRTGLTDRAWCYGGNPFSDDECGKFYARAMSVWSLLLACQGFSYDGPAGAIGFRPVWRPDDHVSFFTVAEGWGLFRQKREAGRQTQRIELRYGTLRLSSLVFELKPGASVSDVAVNAGPKQLAATHQTDAGQIRITLSTPLTLSPGDHLSIRLE